MDGLDIQIVGVVALLVTIVSQWILISRIAGGASKTVVGAVLILGLFIGIGGFVVGEVYRQYAA